MTTTNAEQQRDLEQMPALTDELAKVQVCFVDDDLHNYSYMGTQIATPVANDDYEEQDSGVIKIYHNMLTANEQRVLEHMPAVTDELAMVPVCFKADNLHHSPSMGTQTATSLANDYKERECGTSPYNQNEAEEHGLLVDVPGMVPACFEADNFHYSPYVGTRTAPSLANDDEERESGVKKIYHNMLTANEQRVLEQMPALTDELAMVQACFMGNDLHNSPNMGRQTATSLANDNEERDSGVTKIYHNMLTANEQKVLEQMPALTLTDELAMDPAWFVGSDLHYSPNIGTQMATSLDNDYEERDSGVTKIYHNMLTPNEQRVLEQMPAVTDELAMDPAWFVGSDLHYSPNIVTQTATSLDNDYEERDSGQMPALTDVPALVPACFVGDDLHYSLHMGTQTATSLAYMKI